MGASGGQSYESAWAYRFLAASLRWACPRSL
jgi:hypothetical protein